jgi:serine/threonine protein kinase
MSLVAVCSRQHTWELSESLLEQDSNRSLLCPVCGETGKIASHSDTLAQASLTRTFAAASSGDRVGIATSAQDTSAILDQHLALTVEAYTSPGDLGISADRTTIEGFEILREVGSGGMGVVYEARDMHLGRTVALKMMRGGNLAGIHALERFRREGQAMAQLDHSHIVPIYGHGEHQGQPYFTMKFMAGGNLQDHVDEIGKDPRRTAALLEKVARAVHHLHEKKILHRDLKPHNILFDEAGEPHVTDFGLVKLLDDTENENQTHTGQVWAPGITWRPNRRKAKRTAIAPPPMSGPWGLFSIVF